MLDTSRPASRILALLELLQDSPGITGPRLADELSVSGRTVRRYITTLQDMGIPVEPTTGRLGGYQLRPGFRLPPLMFSADEAIGLAVALLTTRLSDDAELPAPVANALAKIERVLPGELVAQINALREGINLPKEDDWGSANFPNPTILAKLAQASLTRQRCWIRYGRPDGEETAREVEPYGVGALYGRWYLLGWCHLRNDRRTFRIDRIRRMDVLPQKFELPEGVDILTEIEASLALSWNRWRITIDLDASMEEAREYVPRQYAVLEPIDDKRTRLLASSNTLEWFAWRLASLPFAMTIIEPEELRDVFRASAARLIEAANR